MEELQKLLLEQGSALGFGALFLLKTGEMVWKYLRRKEKITEDSISHLKCALEKNTAELVSSQVEMKKLKLDLRRAFYAIKKLSGASWVQIAEEMRNFSNDEIGG
jgi:hypothetical protein